MLVSYTNFCTEECIDTHIQSEAKGKNWPYTPFMRHVFICWTTKESDDGTRSERFGCGDPYSTECMPGGNSFALAQRNPWRSRLLFYLHWIIRGMKWRTLSVEMERAYEVVTPAPYIERTDIYYAKVTAFFCLAKNFVCVIVCLWFAH